MIQLLGECQCWWTDEFLRARTVMLKSVSPKVSNDRISFGLTECRIHLYSFYCSDWQLLFLLSLKMTDKSQNFSTSLHVAKFYDLLRLIRSVLRASKFSVLKLIEIVILWFITPFLLPSACLFMQFWDITFQLLKLLCFWLIITDEGSVPEMSIWSILLIKSNLRWRKHLSRSLFLHVY